MPWKTVSLLKARQHLVEAVLARRQTLPEICRRFGISRKSAYKWLARFRQRGLPGLRDQSRRPCRSPGRLSRAWIQLIEQWRRRRPHWGAKKIHQQLRRKHPRRRVPCARTIQRWLKRKGWVGPRMRRARRGPAVPHPGLTVALRPNQVWTVDFKGWFRTRDGMRQEPLTVRDLFSRYGLGLRLLPNQDDRPARRAMQRLFVERGLPEAIRVDNGSPFGGNGALGLSRLSVWWLRLGIRVEFTRRARPGDNAGHEQFHGCYQREVVAAGAAHRRSMQQRSRRWLARYNEERPHEALGQRTPAQVYRQSRRAFPKELPPLRYPRRWEVRRVRNRGHIKWRGRLRFIGRAFVGQTLGLKSAGLHQWEVFLGQQLIGHLHAHDPGGLRPARWLRHMPLKV
jgi:transposase InsO family protein